jgi:hypothetical protein
VVNADGRDVAMLVFLAVRGEFAQIPHGAPTTPNKSKGFLAIMSRTLAYAITIGLFWGISKNL